MKRIACLFLAALSIGLLPSAHAIDPAAVQFTVPAPAGSYVVHYDGAKGEECVIQVWGMGPATSTPAEKK